MTSCFTRLVTTSTRTVDQRRRMPSGLRIGSPRSSSRTFGDTPHSPAAKSGVGTTAARTCRDWPCVIGHVVVIFDRANRGCPAVLHCDPKQVFFRELHDCVGEGGAKVGLAPRVGRPPGCLHLAEVRSTPAPVRAADIVSCNRTVGVVVRRYPRSCAGVTGEDVMADPWVG